MRIKQLVAIAALLTTGLLITAVMASASHSSHKRAARPQAHSPVAPAAYTRLRLRSLRAVAGSGPPDSVLAAVVSHYGGRALSSAGFEAPPPTWHGTGRWLRFTAATQGDEASESRPLWEADLVAAAVRDRLHALGIQPDLVGVQVIANLPGGQTRDLGGGVGNTVFGQAFSSSTDASIRAAIARAADRLGLSLASVQILHALQPAPAVVVKSADPAAFVASYPAIWNQLFGRAVYEGVYLEAVDASGRPFYVGGAVYRSGAGLQWIRRDLDPRTNH